MTTAIEIPEGYMEKANGDLVPIHKIKEQDLLRDEVAKRLAYSAKMHSEQLAEFKRFAMKEMADLIAIAADQYGVTLGGEKGNLDITSFDGRLKVQRKISDNITFTEEIHAAKALIDACVRTWSEGANSNLVTAVDNAFRTNKKDELVTARILEMLRWNIDGDEQWDAAMKALSDSIMVNSSTTYINVYERDDNGKYQAIPLSLAGV